VSRKRNMFPGTEVLRLLMSHSAGIKFHLGFMDCLKSKLNLHFSEGPLMKHFHSRSSNLIYNVSALHESLVVILQRFKF
jgi:cytochrome b